jgi:hypothetical protein
VEILDWCVANGKVSEFRRVFGELMLGTNRRLNITIILSEASVFIRKGMRIILQGSDQR